MPRSSPRTLAELADHLGLSLATVSLALSGRARALRISPETEARIRAAAERHGVRPNRVAASLRSGRTATIGLVVPDIANPFFAALAQQIERAVRGAGLAVLLADAEESVETEAHSLHELQQRRVDGIILAPVGRRHPVLDRLATKGLPLVVVDRLLPGLKVPQVAIDHAGAAHAATTALLRLGHRRLGCLRGRPGIFSDDERVSGFREALAEAGVPLRSDWIVTGEFTRAAAAGAVRSLLAARKVTGIVSLASQSTLGLLECIRELRVRCPEQLSVVAFEEQPWSNLLSPALSTVEQPVVELAQRTVACLQLRLAGGKPAAWRELLPTRLILRDSIAAPRRGGRRISRE